MTPTNQEDIKTSLEAAIRSRGEEPSSWGDRSLPRVFVSAFAEVLWELWQLVLQFILGGEFTPTTDDFYADKWAASAFGLTRYPATYRVIQAQFAVTGTPVTVAAGELVIRAEEFLFRNIASITVTNGAYVQFEAEVAGSATNVNLAGASLLILLPGVTLLLASEVSPGADKETTVALYLRCQLRWGGIGAASKLFITNLAASLDVTLNRVKCWVPDSPAGTLRIYLASTDGSATLEQCALVDAKIAELELFQAVTVEVSSAVLQVVTVPATIVGATPEKIAEWQTALDEEWYKLNQVAGFGQPVYASDIWRTVTAVLPVGTQVIMSPPAVVTPDATIILQVSVILA